MPRVKPFKYTYQKEIVMYAYYKKLDYFTTECIYAPNATRGSIRDLIKDLEVNLKFLFNNLNNKFYTERQWSQKSYQI